MNEANTYKWKFDTSVQATAKHNGVVFRDVLISLKGTLTISDGVNTDSSISHTVYLQPPTASEGYRALADFTYADLFAIFKSICGPEMIGMLQSQGDMKVASMFVPEVNPGPTIEESTV